MVTQLSCKPLINYLIQLRQSASYRCKITLEQLDGAIYYALYPIGRPVRATITLYPIGTPRSVKVWYKPKTTSGPSYRKHNK